MVHTMSVLRARNREFNVIRNVRGRVLSMMSMSAEKRLVIDPLQLGKDVCLINISQTGPAMRMRKTLHLVFEEPLWPYDAVKDVLSDVRVHS